MSSFNPISFSNLHKYLDALFKDEEPTPEAIGKAKSTYKKAYNAKMQRQRRAKNRYVTLYFSKEEFTLLSSLLPKQKNISKECKTLLLSINESNTVKSINTALIEQLLFEMLHTLEAIENNVKRIEGNRIFQKIFDQLEHIQEQLENE